jgi:hypothetical protein
MLSIARIGGHKTLRMKMHYHAHLEHFAESAVYIYPVPKSHQTIETFLKHIIKQRSGDQKQSFGQKRLYSFV